MKLPSRSDIIASIQNPVCIRDPKLAKGFIVKGRNGNILKYSGGFTMVFPFQTGEGKYAVRCWVADIGNAKKRTLAIERYLSRVQLPYFVDFEFIDEGILSAGEIWPIVKMEWVDGLKIKDYIDQNINSPSSIRILADEFYNMVAVLHDHNIAHGDLQHGNIMVRTDGSVVLVDYDSLFVPELSGELDLIKGLPGYQHPCRQNNSYVNEELDYFSELIIYLSLSAIAEEPDLWRRYKVADTDTMLFSPEDLENPDSSAVFADLMQMSEDVGLLTQALKRYCSASSLADFQKLEDICGQVRKLPWEDKKPIEMERTIENKVNVDKIVRKIQNQNPRSNVNIDQIVKRFKKRSNK